MCIPSRITLIGVLFVCFVSVLPALAADSDYLFDKPKPPAPLNAGELHLVADFAQLKDLTLPTISIDAATLQEAVDKLRDLVLSTPGGANTKIDWKIKDKTLASRGPVHFEEKDIPVVVALFAILDLFAVTARGNPDGSWQFVLNGQQNSTFLTMVDHRIPPEIVRLPKAQATDDPTPEDNMLKCAGVMLPKWAWAMYSPVSGSLLIKDTVVGQLAMRKAIRELWLKHSEKK